MKEQLDLVKILKDCPKGMELDCTMYDNVTLKSVSDDINCDYPIYIETKCGFDTKLTKYGQNICIDDAKCVIFPKGKKTWEGFQRPFVDGDIITSSAGCIAIFSNLEKDNRVLFHCLYGQGVKLIAKKGSGIGGSDNCRFATEHEKEILFTAFKDNGYKWNPETKTLEKLIVPKFKVGDTVISKGGLTCKITDITSEHYLMRIGLTGTGLISIKYQDDYILVQKEKFDPKTLKPFDKVLVRNIGYNMRWNIQFFETMHEDKKKYPFVCLGGKIYSYCIPYAGNEHLLNTINEPSEFYRYWEN